MRHGEAYARLLDLLREEGQEPSSREEDGMKYDYKPGAILFARRPAAPPR